jgi:hypothetical protein
VGFGDVVDVVGCGARVLPRLGADVVRVGFGVTLFVVEGVRRGVYDGLVGRTGADADASSLAVAIDVIGSDWLVTLLLSDRRSVNHPTAASNTRADSDARRGPATLLARGRLWFVMMCSLAQGSACPSKLAAALHEPLTIAIV